MDACGRLFGNDVVFPTMCRRRPFTEGDCKRKFRGLFPPRSDTNAATAHLSMLKAKWGLRYHCDVAQGGPVEQKPTVENIYIVWPWTKSVLQVWKGRVPTAPHTHTIDCLSNATGPRAIVFL